MARHKDFNWNLHDGTPDGKGSTIHSWESIHSALLMDIRDELKTLNRLLHCTRFLEIPLKLAQIKRNTQKPIKKKKRELKIVARKKSAA